MAGADLRLRAERGALPTARSWVREAARLHGLSLGNTQLVELLTSELVSNAVIHGGGPEIRVRATLEDGHFVVEVSDHSDALPVMRCSGPEVPGGHGMRLVDRLTDGWGVERAVDGGKTVWFRVWPSDDL